VQWEGRTTAAQLLLEYPMAPRKLFLLFFLEPAHGKKKHQLAIKRQNARGQDFQEHFLTKIINRDFNILQQLALV
jgi:hypothetical protein